MSDNKCSRRNFLRLGSAAFVGMAGADGLIRGARADDQSQWKMRLSCSSIAFASLPIEQAVQRIADLGFDAIDIWSAHAGCPHLDDVLDRLGPEALKQLLAKHKLDLYSFSVYSGGYPRYAELLGKAGGGVAVHGSGGFNDPDDLTASMKHRLNALKPELELAEKYDSHVALENHSGKSLLNYMDSFKAFTDLNRHPRLGIALAPYHIQINKESVEEAIKICGDQLFFFYAWQHAPGTGQLPGIGPTDCKPWLDALAKVNFRYPVNPFMHHEPAPDEMVEAMAKSCKYLKSCRQESVGAKN
ncbi:MAG: sugar phosphate isomerase/epimerase [Planctomycetes bacterium]|nr:sugar phosphate isomerase/epimerase [Planctomycetota bacterium]MBL7038768.1 sugar phosphate isomerase/epimerase [Pirellulaceae bacterium]